ncbi:MAG TPA: hypothetical protein PLE74_07710 [Candidatus Cloacimonadota bacterium]|nr:hypothetical protein [Candidatus Cloacimonadota bacterium]HPT72151.1 hypothetical protein [Candidatus Cloacimonadota bacterium]
MKAKFRHAVKAFHGKFKSEGLVYCRYNDGALYITRKYPSFTASGQNHKIGNAGRNLGQLFQNVAIEYKHDLKTYATLMSSYTDLSVKLPANSYAYFVKMMYALKRKIPDINLATLTLDDILNNEYPIRTVAEAMEAGLLTNIQEGSNLSSKL